MVKRIKVIAVFLALIFSGNVVAAGPFEVEIIKPASLSKEPLFNQTVLWIAENFKSSKEVIELKDKEMGVIIGNGAVDTQIGSGLFSTSVPVTFKVRIDIKDSKYRMIFSDVKMFFDGYGKPIEDTNRDSNEPVVKEQFMDLSASLDAYLAKPRSDF